MAEKSAQRHPWYCRGCGPVRYYVRDWWQFMTDCSCYRLEDYRQHGSADLWCVTCILDMWRLHSEPYIPRGAQCDTCHAHASTLVCIAGEYEDKVLRSRATDGNHFAHGIGDWTWQRWDDEGEELDEEEHMDPMERHVDIQRELEMSEPTNDIPCAILWDSLWLLHGESEQDPSALPPVSTSPGLIVLDGEAWPPQQPRVLTTVTVQTRGETPPYFTTAPRPTTRVQHGMGARRSSDLWQPCRDGSWASRTRHR